MVTTANTELADKIRCLRDHGATMSDLQRHLGSKPYLLADHPEAGFNQRMTDIQASLGSAQMERADHIVNERRRVASIYDKAFKDFSWLRTPEYSRDYEHGYQSYPCMFNYNNISKGNIEQINKERNDWMEALQTKGISTRPATHAVHMLSFYKDKYKLKPEDFYNSYVANHCSISLPLFHGISDEEIDFVITAVSETNPFSKI